MVRDIPLLWSCGGANLALNITFRILIVETTYRLILPPQDPRPKLLSLEPLPNLKPDAVYPLKTSYSADPRE